MEISKSGLFYRFSTMIMPSDMRKSINSPCDVFFGTFLSLVVSALMVAAISLYVSGATAFFKFLGELSAAETFKDISKDTYEVAVYFSLLNIIVFVSAAFVGLMFYLDRFTFIRASGAKHLTLEERNKDRLYIIEDTSLIAKLGWDNYDSSETRKSGSQILDGVSVPLIIAFCAFSVASVFVSGFLTGVSGEFAFRYDTFFQNGLIGCAFFGAVGYSLYLMCSKSTLTE